MRTLLFALSVLLFAKVFAADFKDDSPLPEEIKNSISEQIEKKCPRVVGVWEDVTVEKISNEKQGVHDRFFFTELRGQWYFDGTHPVSVRIWIESSERDASSSTVGKYEVKALSSDAGEICE